MSSTWPESESIYLRLAMPRHHVRNASTAELAVSCIWSGHYMLRETAHMCHASFS